MANDYHMNHWLLLICQTSFSRSGFGELPIYEECKTWKVSRMFKSLLLVLQLWLKKINRLSYVFLAMFSMGLVIKTNLNTRYIFFVCLDQNMSEQDMN